MVYEPPRNLSSFASSFHPKFLSFSHSTLMPLCFLILHCQSRCFPSSQLHGLLSPYLVFLLRALHLLLRVGYTAIILEYSRGSSSLSGPCLNRNAAGEVRIYQSGLQKKCPPPLQGSQG